MSCTICRLCCTFRHCMIFFIFLLVFLVFFRFLPVLPIFFPVFRFSRFIKLQSFFSGPNRFKNRKTRAVTEPEPEPISYYRSGFRFSFSQISGFGYFGFDPVRFGFGPVYIPSYNHLFRFIIIYKLHLFS